MATTNGNDCAEIRRTVQRFEESTSKRENRTEYVLSEQESALIFLLK